jgi:hypothetical protein
MRPRFGVIFDYAIKDGNASGKFIKQSKDFSPWKAAAAVAHASPGGDMLTTG